MRVALVGGLLVAEYLLLSVLFDAQALLDSAGWTSGIARLGTLGPVLVAIPAAAVLLGKDRLASAWRQTAVARTPRSTAAFALAHVAAFAVVAALTRHLLATAPPSTGAAVAWIAAVVAWLLLGALTVLPMRSQVRFARAAARPLAVGAAVGTVAWAAGFATERLYEPLAAATLHTSYALLAAVAPDAWIEPAVLEIGAGGFWVEVAPVCSGYEGIGMVVVFLAAFLYASRAELRFPRALALVPLAVAAVWLLNAARIAILVVIGATLSPEVALAGFHSKAGWIAVCAVALAAAFAARQSPLFAKTPVRGADVDNPTAAYLVPLLALIAASMVTGAVAVGVDVLYPVRIGAAIGALWLYRSYYRHRAGHAAATWSWAAVGLGVVSFALWVGLEPTADAAAVPAARDQLALAGPLGTVYVASRALGSVLVVPVVEELAFRGYLLRRLAGRDFTAVAPTLVAPVALVASSVAFGLLHQRWLAGTAVGLVFAFAVYRRGRLGDAIIAHAVANLLVAGSVLAFGRWELWLS